MLTKTPEGYFTLSIFAQIPHLVHAFSSRQFGSMNPRDPKGIERRKEFFSLLGVDNEAMTSMDQVHGTRVGKVRRKEVAKVLERTDGLYTAERGVYLAAITADCVPVIVLDRLNGYTGIAHAGWKGVYDGIVPLLVKQLQSEGSKIQSILVGLGPSIRLCCYTIDPESAERWKEKYPESWKVFLSEKDGQVHLSLQDAIMEQLKALGVGETQVDDSDFCTKDHNDEIYSYRAEGDKEYMSEFVTVIGMS